MENPKKLPELSKAYSKYGADMGRRDTHGEYDLPQHFMIQKLAWVDGDYDTGGAYWGKTSGENIYRCYAYDTADGAGIEHFKRATSHQKAFVQIVEEYPLATFEILPDELDESEPGAELHYGYVEGIEIGLTLDDAREMSHPGQCDDDVSAGRQKAYIAEQLSKLSPHAVAAAVKSCGGWDAEQLTDHNANLDRLLWLVAGDITDNVTE